MLHEAWPDLIREYRVYPDDVHRFSPQEWHRMLDRLADLNHSRG